MSGISALLLALALGAEARVEAGVRLETRARHTDPARPPEAQRAVDVAAVPTASLHATSGASSLTATYAPRFAAADLGPDVGYEHLQQGELRLRIARGARFQLELFGTGSAGRTDLLTWRQGAPPGSDPGAGGGTGTGTGSGSEEIATTERIDREALRTGLSLRLAPVRRVEVLLAGAVFEDGGTDARSRALHPVERGSEASAEVRWSATRIDAFGARWTGSQSRIAALRTDSAWASALATYRHRFSRQVELSTGAGALVFESRAPSTAFPDQRTSERSSSAAAELLLSRAGDPGEPAGTLGGELGADASRVTGLVTPSAAIRTSVRWPTARRVTFLGSGAGTLSWSDRGRTRTGQLTLGASYRLAPWASLELNGAGTWQRSTDPALLDTTIYAATVALSLQAPGIPF